MDTKETQEQGVCSSCGACMHCMGKKYGQSRWAHVVIKILVAVFIFWCGVQFGELKSLVHGGYYSQHGSTIYAPAGYGMMGGWAQ